MAIGLSPTGTTLEQGQVPGLFKVKDSKEKQDCIARGGKWDAENGVCIMPEPEVKPKVEPKKPLTASDGILIKKDTPKTAAGGYIPTGRTLPDGSQETKLATPEEYAKYRQEQGFREADPTSFGTLKSNQTGDLSGFTRGGKQFFGKGVGAEDVRGTLEREAFQQELEVEGQAETLLGRRAEQLQAEGVQVAGQIGDTPDEQTLEQIRNDLNQRQLDHTAAIASAAPSLLQDFAYGAAGAAAFTKGRTFGIVPAVVGLGNALIGAFGDYVSDITGQQRDIIETPIRTLTESKGVLTAIISGQNANPQNAQNNLDAWNVVRTQIDMEYEFLKELSDDDLNKFLGENAINQMKEYEVYYQLNGERDRLDQEFAEALANPDPAKVSIPIDIQEILKEKMKNQLK